MNLSGIKKGGRTRRTSGEVYFKWTPRHCLTCVDDNFGTARVCVNKKGKKHMHRWWSTLV